jgi:hypothetical protein
MIADQPATFFEDEAVNLSRTVTDNSVSLKVVKQASIAGASGPTTGSPGHSLTFTLTATDAAADQGEGFTYGIEWDHECRC